MADSRKTPIPSRDPADPPPEVEVADPPPEVEDRGETKQKSDPFTKSSADEALRFMKIVWSVTVALVFASVAAYFLLQPTIQAFTETVLGIMIGGIVGCGFTVKFVFKMQR